MCDLGRVALVCGATGGRTNAILQYTRLLNKALLDLGVDCTLVEADRTLPELRGYDTVVLQYNPFLYGRWGFAPQLPALLWRLRARRRAPKIALMTHELYFPVSDWRSALMGSWQRLQLWVLHALADLVFTSIEPWARLLSSWRPTREVLHLPVGSNLPDGREQRERARDEIGARRDTLVVVSFGTGHPSRLMSHTVAAANAISQDHRVLLLNLGAGAQTPVGLDLRVKVVQPGWLPDDDAARMLSAGDLFLAPFIDGVSTRRGSVMAALQHGLPVLSTVGASTGVRLLRSGAIELVTSGDAHAFAQAARKLASDDQHRTQLGAAARELYLREFTWSMIATRMLAGIAGEREPNALPDRGPSVETAATASRASPGSPRNARDATIAYDKRDVG